MSDMVIKMKDYGNGSIIARVLGIEIKNKVLEDYKQNNYDKIVFDFDGVDQISTGFAKELFGELSIILGDNFPKVVGIKIPEDNKVIKDMIIRGIQASKTN